MREKREREREGQRRIVVKDGGKREEGKER